MPMPRLTLLFLWVTTIMCLMWHWPLIFSITDSSLILIISLNEIKWKMSKLQISRARVREFNTTFNNILVISWWSVSLVVETGVPRENHRPALSHWQTLSRNVVSSTPRLSEIRTHNVSGDRHWLNDN